MLVDIRLIYIYINIYKQPSNDCTDCNYHISQPHHPSCWKTRGSVEVGALFPVFEKSPTELKLKPKQKLLICKNTVHIVTFNVRNLKRIGLLSDLIAPAAEHNIDIVCIQEYEYPPLVNENICMEKLRQCRHRTSKNAARFLWPKII